jgi:hypothetical protein
VAKFFNDQGGLQKLTAQLELAKARMPANVREAHVHCSKHRAEILTSESCACFYCLKTFGASQIEDWVDDGQTALCPKCGIDSMIGSAAGFALTPEFLEEMHKHWF